MSSPQRRRRLSACVLAVLCLGGQLGSVAHFALVQHARCAEHGELVHQDAPGPIQAGLAHTRQSSLASSYEAGARSSVAHEQHEHCVASNDRRDQATLGAARSMRQPQLDQAGKLCAQAAMDPLARERWLLAPKSSPPA